MKNKNKNNKEKNIIREEEINYISKTIEEIKKEKLTKKLNKKKGKNLKDKHIYRRIIITTKHIDEFLLKNYRECLVDYKIKKGYIDKDTNWIEPVIIVHIIDKNNNNQFVHKRTLYF